MLLLGWAGASVVSTLTAEATLATTRILARLSHLALFKLFPKPAVTPGYFVFGSVLGFGSLVDSANPRSGCISKLIFRTLDAVLLGKALNSGVSFFDLWTTTTVVSELTTVLTLNSTTHISLPYICIISWIWHRSSFLFTFRE
jgi:hypothetical protein